MNTPTSQKRILPLLVLSASWSLMLSPGLQAQTAQTWNNAASSGLWTATDANWNGSVWTNNNNAVFGSTAGITVTSSTDIVVNDITFSTTGYTVAGALKLANDLASTITVSTDAATISANISNNSLGASSLTKSGTGMLILSGSNSYSGATTLSQGTLAINSAYALGTGTLIISGGTLNNTSGSPVTVATNNAQKWTGSFTYSGTGTLNLGTGTASIATGGAANTSITITTNNGNLVIGGVISGTNTYGINKAGNGTLTLAGLNTYGYATVVTGGTLAVTTLADGGQASSIGTSTGSGWALQIKNAALLYTGTGSSTNRSLYIDTAGTIANEGTGALVFSNSAGSIGNNADATGTANKTLTFTGANSSANTVALKIGDPTAGKTTSIIKNGTGFWAFTNSANSYTGVTTINAGVLSVQSIGNGGATSALGASSSAASNLVLAGGTLQYTGVAASTDRLFTVTTGGGAIDGSGSGISFANTGALVMLGSGARTLTLTGTSTANSLASQIQDNGGATSLVKNGSGTWVLTGSNSFTGGVTMNAGQLTVGNAYALGTGTVTINGGALATASGSTVTLATNNTQIWAGDFYYGGGTLNLGTGGVTLTGNRYLAVLSGNLIVDGIIGSGGAAYNLTKTGPGTLTLTGSNTFTGALVITSGTVAVTSLNNGGVASSIGMAGTDGWALQLKNSALVYTGTGSTTNRQMYIDTAGTIDNEGTGALIFSNTGGTISNNINASGTANKTITLTGNNTANNTIALQILDPTAGKATSIVKSGVGYWLLSGANTYSGTTSVQNGTLAFQSTASGTAAQALGSGNTVTLGVAATSSGTLQYTGGAGTFDKNVYALGYGLNTIKNSGSGLLTLAGSLIKDGTILVLDGGASGITVTGTISGSSSSSDLYITGGTTTLTAVNTYSGPTWVYGGGVLVNGNTHGALPTDTLLTLGAADNSTGTFNLNGNGQTVAGLSSTGTGANVVTNNGSTAAVLTVTNGGTYSGTIRDGASTTGLTVSGGNLLLGGSNHYTGATTVTGGTLSIQGSLDNTAVNISSAAELNGTGTINGTVTNSGAITGSLIFDNNVTINAGATAAASAFNGNIANNGTITSAVTVKQGKVLSGSGTVTANVNVNSATVNGNGLNLGDTTLTGQSTLSGINTASSVTVQSGSTALTGTTTATSLTVSVGAALNHGGVINADTHLSGWMEANGTINGNLVMDSTATLFMEIAGSTAGSFDRLKVSGNIELAGTLDLTLLGGLTAGNTITLIDNLGTGTTTQGYFDHILTSGDTYIITEAGSSYRFTLDGTEYLLNYAANADGDGVYNDVTLSVVPEPGTWAMLLGGLGMLLGAQAARRKK